MLLWIMDLFHDPEEELIHATSSVINGKTLGPDGIQIKVLKMLREYKDKA